MATTEESVKSMGLKMNGTVTVVMKAMEFMIGQ